jgi:Flp pilus assembly protein TadG
MNMNGPLSRANTRNRLQRGAAAVEFALVTAFFLLALLLGIIELGRAFFYMNAAAEATRWGARLAVVCDVSEATRNYVRAAMQGYVSVLPAGQIGVDYEPQGCVRGTCRSVTVSIRAGTTYESLIPTVNWTLPPFSTTLPTESLDSANTDCSGT